jgi:hypothetical protein
MKSFALGILVAGLTAGAAIGSGQKMIEIDKAGNVKTSVGHEIGQKQAPKPPPEPANEAPSKAVDICAPDYTWSPDGLSADTMVRARAFYKDVTQPYERESKAAEQAGQRLSREREAQYWNAYAAFLKAVPKEDLKIVQQGVSPRLESYCHAPPVIQEAGSPPPAPMPEQPQR